MHLSDRIQQLEKDYPIGRESELIRKRWWLGLWTHVVLIAYSVSFLVLYALLFRFFHAGPALFQILLTLVFGLGVYFFFMSLMMAYFLWRQRDTPPTGAEVKREQAPKLFDVINDVGAQHGNVKVSRVWITPEFNAGARKTRSARTLYFPRKELRIGIYLLHSCSVEQLRSVVAHELEHFNQSALDRGWIVGEAAHALWNAVHQRHFLPIRKMLRTLEHKIRTISHVLARRVEYRCDEASVRTCGKETAASFLVSMATLGQAIGRSFHQDEPGYFLKSDQPPDDSIEQVLEQLASYCRDDQQLQLDVQQQMKAAVSSFANHPCPSDRIRRMGVSTLPDTISLASSEQAVSLLGDQTERVHKEINDALAEMQRDWWNATYRWITRLEETTDFDVEPENAQQAWDRYYLSAYTQGFTQAKKWLDRVLEFKPIADRAKLKLASGVFYFPGDDTGDDDRSKAVGQLVELMKSPGLVVAEEARDVLVAQLELNGESEKLKEIERLCDEIEFRSQDVFLEKRASLFGDYVDPVLPAWMLDGLIELFESQPSIAKVSVARKRIRNCHTVKYLVFAVRFISWEWKHERLLTEISRKIGQVIHSKDVEFQVVSMFQSFPLVLNRIEKVEGAEIYRKAMIDQDDTD